MDFYFPTTLFGELELDYSFGQKLAISQNNDNQGLFGTGNADIWQCFQNQAG